MGRKKKKVEATEEAVDEGGLSFLHGDAKRSIVAIVLFVLALLFMLGFFGVAGVVGDFFNDVSGKIFGWGKVIFPPVLMVVAVFLLKRKQSSLSEIVKLVGLVIAFWSLLGMSHLFVSGSMEKAALAGDGGGYLGYFLAGALQKFTGTIAGAIILVALFFTGLILAFNLSIIHSIESLKNRLSKERISKGKSADEYDDSIGMTDLDEASIAEGMTVHEDASMESLDSLMESEAVLITKEEQEEKEREMLALQAENIRTLEFIDEKRKASAQLRKEVVDNNEDDDDEIEEESQQVIPKKRRSRKSRKWILPSPTLLEAQEAGTISTQNEHNAVIIQQKLKHFDIDVEIGDIQTGPTVTQYTFRPTPGTKLSKITALSNELAYELAAQSVRIEAPIPGKSLVGIEVPNQTSTMVRLQNILAAPVFTKRESNLMLVLGQDVFGEYVVGDLAKMPHLLVAGSTNSGKSVCINSLLLSLLYQNSPDDLKLILVDPKRVELSLYNGIPHLLTDVIVENKKVVNVLKWAVSEMERRYKVLQKTGSRDLGSYKQKIENGETYPSDTNPSEYVELEKLPYIIIVIDEMADLIMAHGKDVEGLIARLAQMSRAVGIHLILATQRPSVEVLTGLIKANITTRIAFKVATQIDSRTILDQGGAEKLLGKGDMLYLFAGNNQPKRVQGVFISENEVKRVVDVLKEQKRKMGNEEDIPDAIAGTEQHSSVGSSMDMNFDIDVTASNDRSGEDDLYGEAKNLVIQAGKASASLLQRRLRVGYSRAARILDLLEADGIIGPADGAKPREVYADGSNGNDGYAEDASVESEASINIQEKRDSWHA